MTASITRRGFMSAPKIMLKPLAEAIVPYCFLAALSAALFLSANASGYSITSIDDNASQILAGISLIENHLLDNEGGGQLGLVLWTRR